MDWEQYANDAEKMADEMQKAAEKAANTKPIMTLQTFEVWVVVLLAIIAVCLVIITIHILKNSSGINLILPHMNTEDIEQESTLSAADSNAATVNELTTISAASVAEKILALNQLRKDGTISEEQFQTMKQRILNSNR